MTPDNSTIFDVVVGGGGHNGLVAAAYLARAGLRVRLLEWLDLVGGAAVSAQAFDGVDARLSHYAYLVSLLPKRILEDLGAGVTLARRHYSSYTPNLADGHTARRSSPAATSSPSPRTARCVTARRRGAPRRRPPRPGQRHPRGAREHAGRTGARRGRRLPAESQSYC